MSKSLLADYCRQAVTIKTKGTVDAFNTAAFASAWVNVRLQYKRKLVRNRAGEEVQSNSQIFTTATVSPDDVVIISGVDYPVIAVEVAADISGAEQWREVYL